MTRNIFLINPSIYIYYAASADSSVMSNGLKQISLFEKKISPLNIQMQSLSEFQQSDLERDMSRSHSKR